MSYPEVKDHVARDVYRPTRHKQLKDASDPIDYEMVDGTGGAGDGRNPGAPPRPDPIDPPGPDPDPDPPVEELKFDQQPLCSGTGKPGRTLTGTMGTAQGGVKPYKPYVAKWRYKDPTRGNAWVDITDFSEDDPQEYVVKQEDVGTKINFYQKIEDAAGTVKQTGSSKDIIEDTQPLKVDEKADWKDDNCYQVGCTAEARTATFTGGHFTQTTYRSRIQTRKDADDSWSNGVWTNHDNEHIYITYTFDDTGQCRVATQARDEAMEPVETVNSFASTKTVTAPPAMVVSAPTVTGQPVVGQIVFCSQPTVTGGIGPFQYDYFWVDESNVIVWDATKMAPNTIVTEYDVGKMMKCLVTVTDKGWKSGESVTVESNSIGPVTQPTIGDLVVMNASVDPQFEIPNGSNVTYIYGASVTFTVDHTGSISSNDLTYAWSVRNGAATIRGATDLPYVTVETPGEHPSASTIMVAVSSQNGVASDNPQSSIFNMVSTDGGTSHAATIINTSNWSNNANIFDNNSATYGASQYLAGGDYSTGPFGEIEFDPPLPNVQRVEVYSRVSLSNWGRMDIIQADQSPIYYDNPIAQNNDVPEWHYIYQAAPGESITMKMYRQRIGPGGGGGNAWTDNLYMLKINEVPVTAIVVNGQLVLNSTHLKQIEEYVSPPDAKPIGDSTTLR